MDRFENNTEARNEWVAPELNKIDVEQITANGKLAGSDGNGPSTGS